MRRLNCERYPCHFPDQDGTLYQDCTFCFCPFYPCFEPRTGGRFEDGTWSCECCTVIHREDVAEMVMDSLMQGEALDDIWKKVAKLL
ncbi:MAG: cysteine-rich small domain-containing protein [Euryarchaeota archaeon]|nr:cysteine-rich small domain-containing protein [Euryarchaeota archaeon]